MVPLPPPSGLGILTGQVGIPGADAARLVPETVRLGHPEVDWKKIAGLRDILIHQYFGVDAELIWDIIQNKLAALEEQIRAIIKS